MNAAAGEPEISLKQVFAAASSEYRAVTRFIELTHERSAKELGTQLDDVALFFTDEPQLGAAESWMHMALQGALPAVQSCDELPVAFERKKSYPITDALPALFHDVGPPTGRYRHDFYDVYSDLIAANYFGQIQDWCRRHNVPSSGHMLLEESLLFHLMGQHGEQRLRQRTDG